MRIRAQYKTKRIKRFFYVTTAGDSLLSFIDTNFQMKIHHNFSLYDIDNMLPWEREVYIELLIKHVKDEEERIKRET